MATRPRLGRFSGNALKHGLVDGKGRIEISALDRGTIWQISVVDRGQGLSPSQHNKAFDIFSRLHEITEGTGIGLAVVPRLVEAEGGRVWIDSEDGRGAAFRFI